MSDNPSTSNPLPRSSNSPIHNSANSDDNIIKVKGKEISANTTTNLSFSSSIQDQRVTGLRKKSLQEKYHPVDASGNLLHAKIVDSTCSNPHHTHLDVHHPSPVRNPSPSRAISKYPPSKLGNTEKMRIDKYEDGKKHILVGATGSVASVKIPLIVKSLLAHEDVEVQVIVTKTAKNFFDVEKLKTELDVKVWEDEDDWKVPFTQYLL